MTHVLVARVVRSGFDEGAHYGTAVAIDAAGQVVASLGDPAAPMFPRSSVKPLQAVALLRAGLDLDDELLALVASSHSGERFHLDGVQRILASAALDVSALRNTPDLPLDDAERLDWQRAGRAPSSLAQNCSGKHAGMLAACAINGWPTASYLGAGHPLQVAIAATVTELTGAPPAAVGVDGCGAPLFATSAVGLARAFARLATGDPHTDEGRVARAIRNHPEWVGGTGRDVTELIRGVPGLIAKDGAEGVYAAAMPDGRAAVVKIADGAARARLVVLTAALRRLGVDAAVLDELGTTAVLGHGVPVGAVHPVDLV